MTSIREQVLNLWYRDEPMKSPSWIATVLGMTEQEVVRIIARDWLTEDWFRTHKYGWEDG